MYLNKDTIEVAVQKTLPYYFILIFVSTVSGSIVLFLEQHGWAIGDWLINYQGGMVRRGLMGELIYQFAQYTHANLGIVVVIIQSFFYAVFLYFSYALLKQRRVLLPYIFLIFSPFIFMFQIHSMSGGYRKEIIYFAILAFVVWVANTKDKKSFEKIFYITLLLYPAIILTHEMLAIFLPYLLVVYLLVTTLTMKKLFYISILLLPSVGAFIASIYYSGTSSHVVEIFNSLAQKNYSNTGGSIYWLNKDLSYGLKMVLSLFDEKIAIAHMAVMLLAALAFVPIYGRLKNVVNNKLSIVLIIISLIGTAVLFFVAVDWGRFIYIHLVSIFLLSLLSIQDEKEIKYYENGQPVTKFIAIFFAIYISVWQIPHVMHGSVGNFIVASFARPYAKIFVHNYPEYKKYFK